MKNKLLIIGASGHGKVVADIALKMNQWGSIAFLDDDASIMECLGIKVIGNTEVAFLKIQNHDIFVAIGNNTTRKMLQEKLQVAGASIPVLIHPNTTIGKDVELGTGSAVMAGVVINSSTKIGKGCIINTGATIDHDNDIGDYVHISPGVHTAGSVAIGEETWLGTGSVVSNNIKITCGCKVGAGAVVVKDMPEPGIYAGVPARRVK